MSRRHGRRSGFITALAITMIALIAVALAMLTARVNTVARQAMQERERAQAEELVLAGIEAAKADPGAKRVELPAGLREAGAWVTIARRGGRAEVEAVVGRAHATGGLVVKER